MKRCTSLPPKGPLSLWPRAPPPQSVSGPTSPKSLSREGLEEDSPELSDLRLFACRAFFSRSSSSSKSLPSLFRLFFLFFFFSPPLAGEPEPSRSFFFFFGTVLSASLLNLDLPLVSAASLFLAFCSPFLSVSRFSSRLRSSRTFLSLALKLSSSEEESPSPPAQPDSCQGSPPSLSGRAGP